MRHDVDEEPKRPLKNGGRIEHVTAGLAEERCKDREKFNDSRKIRYSVAGRLVGNVCKKLGERGQPDAGRSRSHTLTAADARR